MIGPITITGTRSLALALERLPAELAKAAETTALREAMKPVMSKAKALAPKGPTGLLKKSIGITVRKNKKSTFKGQYTARVGARNGFSIPKMNKDGTRAMRNGKPAFVNPAKYAQIVELGTSKSAAKPFIRPAVESSESAMLAGLAAGYEKGVSKAVAKLRKRK